MKCPLINKTCVERKCAWWCKTTVKDTATQKAEVVESCLVTQIPSMLIEVIKNTGSVQSATEQVRNRMEHVVHNGEAQNKIFAGLAEMSRRKSLGDSA